MKKLVENIKERWPVYLVFALFYAAVIIMLC